MLILEGLTSILQICFKQTPIFQSTRCMRYLLDANTYIQAKNQYYGMDICPAYYHRACGRYRTLAQDWYFYAKIS
ncbi:TPA: DUF4411 family protein [Kluyvera cryocrescens]|nr:DUF4411 family protein [Kluyvera cryocrescens]